MKPAYEIVRADELRVKDVFKFDVDNPLDGHEYVISVGRIPGCDMTQIGFTSDAEGYPYHNESEFLRQLPPERNPDALMRALEIAAKQLLDAKHVIVERKSPKPSADDIKHYIKSCIDRAIRELESEAGK